MPSFPSTLVIRHKRENLKKCSLRGLESREDFIFVNYPSKETLNLDGYVLLTLDAEPLSELDRDYPLLLVDATWRYAEKMLKNIRLPHVQLICRSLPAHFRTAYPRCQHDCPSPERGLASVEALFLAYLSLHRPVDGLLNHYYWKEEFLVLNNLHGQANAKLH